MWMLLTCSAFVLLALPVAAILPAALKRRPEVDEWLFLSAAGSFGLSMVIGWISLRVPGAVAPAALLVVVLAVAYGWKAPRPKIDSLHFAGAIALCVSLVPRAYYQIKFGTWPRGWDPMVHLTVVRASLLQHGLPTSLDPLEAVSVHYPWGSHLSIIGISFLTGVPPHTVFAAENSLVGGALSALAIVLFGRQALGTCAHGAAAMIVYLNVVHFGGADYQNWGGLPNQLGMALFVGGYAFLIGNPSSAWAGRALLGMAFIVHHHTMLVALGVITLHGVVVAFATGTRSEVVHWLRHGAIGMALAAPATVPLAVSSLSLGSTGTLRYHESYDWLAMVRETPGALALALASAGAAALWRRPTVAGGAPLVFLASLLSMFAVFGGAWRVGTSILFNDPTVAFNASRFVTDAAYPVAVLGAAAVTPLFTGWRSQPLAAALVGVLALSEQWLWMKYRDTDRPYDEAMFSDVVETGKYVPADALVVADFPGAQYAPYLLQRECAETPRPHSELPEPKLERKKVLARKILSGTASQQDLPAGRRVWVVRDKPLPPRVVERVRVGRIVAGEWANGEREGEM